ncbi:phosphotransferase enzyme family protein [Glycomyces sp. NPDC048151]|uniref:phosphotransferase enzyme family protein n=1 Tax=Glycomyces sp. NPDC048151 TaxID=3364002 RepID=UPI003723659E
MLPTDTAFDVTTRNAADQALTAYDLPQPLMVEPIRLLNNAVYKVTTADGRRLVLRVHRPGYRHPAHTRSELVFLDAVHERLAGVGVRVPAPVPAKDGALTVEAVLPERTVHCDLLTWIDGQVHRPENGLGPKGVHAIGRALAHLHNVAETFTPPAGFRLPTWDSAALFTEASPYRPGDFRELLSPADRTDFDTVADETAALFARLGRDRDAYGVVHHDFILGNLHPTRTPQGWSIGVFDFDETGWGHYLADLGPVLGNLYDYPQYRRLRAALLDGYRSARALPAEMEAHLPLLMAARHAAQCLWAAGLVASNGSAEVDTVEHIGWRMGEVRRCLALRSSR